MNTAEDGQMPLPLESAPQRRRRERAQLYAKVLTLRQAGCAVYRASDRQVRLTIADRTRLLTHGELLSLILAEQESAPA
jgi:hypothetical protein